MPWRSPGGARHSGGNGVSDLRITRKPDSQNCSRADIRPGQESVFFNSGPFQPGLGSKRSLQSAALDSKSLGNASLGLQKGCHPYSKCGNNKIPEQLTCQFTNLQPVEFCAQTCAAVGNGLPESVKGKTPEKRLLLMPIALGAQQGHLLFESGAVVCFELAKMTPAIAANGPNIQSSQEDYNHQEHQHSDPVGAV